MHGGERQGERKRVCERERWRKREMLVSRGWNKRNASPVLGRWHELNTWLYMPYTQYIYYITIML